MKCNYLKPWCNTITSLLDWQKLERRDTRKAECRRGGQPSNFTPWNTSQKHTYTYVSGDMFLQQSFVNNLTQPKHPPVSQRRVTKTARGMLASKDAASSRALRPRADGAHYCGPLIRAGTRRGAETEGQTHTRWTWAVTCKRLFIKLYKKAQEVRSLEGGVTSWIIWKS